MTVQTNTNVATFNGNGVTQIFPIAFKFNNDTDLVVLRVDDETGAASQLTLNSDYTVSGEGDEEGGLINVVIPPVAGQRLRVIRIVDILQLTDLRNQGKFFAEVHEDAFDLLTMIAQQHESSIRSTLRVAESDPEPARIPAVAQRAGKILSFDASGNPQAVAPVADSSTALRIELANGSNSLVDAAVVGFQRSAESLPGFVSDQLRGQAVQILEFIPKSQWAAIKDGTSAYDATANVQAAIDYAASAGKAVEHSEGVIVVSRIIPKPGLRGLFGFGAFKQSGSFPGGGQAMVEVLGPFHGEFGGIDSCYFGQLTLDLNGSTTRGFFGSAVSQCIFDSLTLRNFGGSNSAGIRLNWDCSENKIINNKVVFPVVTNSTDIFFGIQIVGQAVDGYGGYGAGNFITASKRCVRNIIYGNTVFFGTHGISLNAAEYNTVFGNYLEGQHHRSIHLSPQGKHNLISTNNCYNFGSAAVTLGYDSSNNVIVSNNCFSTLQAGESAIQAYVGCSSNHISGNRIRAGTNYGIYLAVDAVLNSVIGNTIEGTLIRKACIAIESEWAATPTAPFIYSRPNYETPPGTRTTWANGNSLGNRVNGNSITTGRAGTCAIYVSQVGSSARVDLGSFTSNDIESSAFAHTYYFVEATSGLLSRQTFNTNVTSLQEVTKAFATRGRAHFLSMQGNDTFNGDVEYSVDSGSTPSAFFSDKISLAAYASATNVTGFSGGRNGQTIRVRVGTNVTLIHSAGALSLKGAVNAVGVTNGLVQLENRGGVWYEITRSW